MKKLIFSLMALVLAISLTACGSGDNGDSKVPETTRAPETRETSGVSGDRTVSGFDTKANKTITWCGIDFSFPSYFSVLDKSSTETWMTYYPEEEDYYASIMFQSQEFLGTQDDFNSRVSSIVKSFMDGKSSANPELQNVELQKTEKITIAGLPGWTITFSVSDIKTNEMITTGSFSFVYNINAGKIVMISCGYDSNDNSHYDYLGDYQKVLKTAKLLTEPIDLNAINRTSSAESDAKFVGRYWRVTGMVDQAMGPSDGINALVIIEPNVMAEGMGSTFPLEINIWLTADEFEKIGGISSVGKQIDLSVKLKSISSNSTSNPAVKGYPIQLEFGEPY